MMKPKPEAKLYADREAADAVKSAFGKTAKVFCVGANGDEKYLVAFGLNQAKVLAMEALGFRIARVTKHPTRSRLWAQVEKLSDVELERVKEIIAKRE